jgi:dipeptidase E
MEFLLTSTGLTHPEITEKILQKINSEPCTKRLLLIQNAATNKEEQKYANESLKELIDLGFKEKNISICSTENDLKKTKINFLIIVVTGGNTFHLWHDITSSKFDKKLLSAKNKNILYIGISAGSLIVTPSIAIANEDPADDNFDKIKNFSALSLIDFEISVHTPEIVKLATVKNYAKKTRTKIIAISNKTAIHFKNDYYEILGDKKSVLFDYKNYTK